MKNVFRRHILYKEGKKPWGRGWVCYNEMALVKKVSATITGASTCENSYLIDEHTFWTRKSRSIVRIVSYMLFDLDAFFNIYALKVDRFCP